MRTSLMIFFVVIITGMPSCMMNRQYPQGRNYENYGRSGGYASIQLFYDALSPYGDWVHNREYGYVWIPHTGRNFYPYATNGRWLMTEYGWTWVSDYSWGWAPFHYGRWDYDVNYGWFWFPDTEWGPAWVVWRSGNGYYGWAPMTPGMNIGMSFGRDYDDYDRWIFVRERDFGRSSNGRYFMNRRRNDELVRSTRIINNTITDRSRNSTYMAGPDPIEVQRSTGRRISTYSISDNDRPGTRVRSREVQIYRPRVANTAEGNRPAPPVIRDVKDVRPMRERNRNYQPGVQPGDARDNDLNRGQGTRPEVNQEQVEIDRRRETDRLTREKQDEMKRRQQQAESEQRQRSRDGDDQIRKVQKANRQQKAGRRQNTDQQKRVMQKERETRREAEADSTRVRRTERQSTVIRRR